MFYNSNPIRTCSGKRKALEHKAQSASPSVSRKKGKPEIDEEQMIPCWVETRQKVVLIPASAVGEFFKPGSPLIPLKHDPQPMSSKMNSNLGGVIFPISSDHTITLLQFNVIRGLLTIRHLLSAIFPPQNSQGNECSTAAYHVLPDLSSCPTSLPASLHPTHLQQTVPHEEWVEGIVHPVMRDNIIRAIGTFDEDQLWSDTIGGLFEGFPDSEVERRGVICWSTPWHFSGWEMSEGFLKRWGWSIKGCESDILGATNKWRVMRGEDPLMMEI